MKPASFGLPWLTAALALLAACDQPPANEIAAAQAALQQARKDQADRYAPDRVKEAEAALAAARRKVEGKDYRGALSAATEAAERSHTASQQANAAKTTLRGAAEVTRAEAEAALDDADAARLEATKDKVPESALETANAVVAAVRGELEALGRAIESSDPMAAQKQAAKLRARATPLAQAYRDAAEAWKASRKRVRK
jgi:hypothetical protein